MVATQTRPADVEQDQRIRMHGVPWSHYEILLAVRGEAPVPRIAYLQGELELMSSSQEHEIIKSVLNLLIMAYAAERGLDLWPVGSWTVRSAPNARGLEPDECYCIGDPRRKDAPDLAVEVVWTSGGIDKLEIYRGLGVGEVWFWRDERIEVFVLREDAYHQVDRSELLPDLDVDLVGRLAMLSPAEAIAQLRASL